LNKKIHINTKIFCTHARAHARTHTHTHTHTHTRARALFYNFSLKFMHIFKSFQKVTTNIRKNIYIFLLNQLK